MRRCTALSACLLIWSSPLAGQDLSVSATGAGAGDGLGADVTRILDRDGDRRDDLAVGAPDASPGGVAGAGELVLVSYKDGSRFATVAGTRPAGRFGQSVLELPDLDGDGIPELLVGEPGESAAFPGGRLLRLDGATLQTTGQLAGPGPGARLGERMVLLDDLDGDGRPEVAASAPSFTAGMDSGVGAVLIIDPVTLSTTRTLRGVAAFDAFGTGLGSIPDMNADGKRDLVIGSPGFDPVGLNGAGLVEVWDPTNGAVLRAFPGVTAADSMGFSCDGLPDLDSDLIPDLIVGAPAADPSGIALAGEARLLSGQDGQVLATHPGLAVFDSFGWVVAALDDLDGDGLCEYACGSPQAAVDGMAAAGRVIVYSGASQALLYEFEGGTAYEGLGWSVRPLLDMNADSRNDLAIGSPGADEPPGSNSGRLEVRLGQVAELTAESTGQYGTPFTIRIQGTPHQTVLLLLDVAEGSQQTGFGEICLALSPSFIFVSLGPLWPDGWLELSGTLPPSGTPDQFVFLQCLVTNPFAPPSYWAGGCESLVLTP